MSRPRDPVVARVGALLRAMSQHSAEGLTTTQAARHTGVPRPSAHRLLTALSDEGLVDREETGRWFLGPETYLLGATASSRYDVSPAARRVVTELAELTGESSFFSARRGAETICLVREDGSFPLRSHVLHEGIRFPLGVASAGLAILSHLQDREIDTYLSSVDLRANWGEVHAADRLRRSVERTRVNGYSTNPGLIVEGSWGMGAAVFDRLGRPRWALSLTGVESRFSEARRPSLGKTLLTASHRLTRMLQDAGQADG